MKPRRFSILGCTGSIGQSAASVIRHAQEQSICEIEFEALAAGSDVESLAAMALEFRPKVAVIADQSKLPELKERLRGTNIGCEGGTEAVAAAAQRSCDRVLAAIVGSAGLPSTLAAVQAGNSVAIANKESIVCAGALIRQEAAKTGASIIPVDSEHNAIFQSLEPGKEIAKITITASGGPFRCSTLDEMHRATPEAARAHPVWDMGLKNSIDSATLMNKALEFIEAARLFDLDEARIDVLVHPQSIIHGMAHYADGSVLAQLGSPDMRTPIAHALMWPDRIATPVEPLDLEALGKLTFEAVDESRFKAITLAREAVRAGSAAQIALNGANEVAVEAFADRRCGFLDITETVSETIERFSGGEFAGIDPASLDDVLMIDAESRRIAAQCLARIGAKPVGVA